MRKSNGYYMRSYLKNNWMVLICELTIVLLLALICTIVVGGQPTWLTPTMVVAAYVLAELRFMMAYVATVATKAEAAAANEEALQAEEEESDVAACAEESPEEEVAADVFAQGAQVDEPDTADAFVVEEHTLVKNGVETQFSFSQSPEAIDSNVTKAAFDSIQGYVFDHVEVTNLATGETVAFKANEQTEANDYVATVPNGGLHFEFFYRYNRFDVYYQSTEEIVTYDLVDTFNVTERVHNGYLYGGMYTDENFGTPLTEVGKNKGDGMDFQPEAGATYYVKEVDNRYARPGLYLIWHKRPEQSYKMFNLYLLTAIDNCNYLKVGVEIEELDQDGNVTDTTEYAAEAKDGKVDSNTAADESCLHSEFVVNYPGNENNEAWTDKETASSLFFGDSTAEEHVESLLYVHDFTEFVKAAAEGRKVRYSCFFVTPDGIRVEGVKYRDMYMDSTKDNVTDKLTYNNFVRTASAEIPSVCTRPAAAAVQSFAPLMMRSSYTVSGTVSDLFTITSVDGKVTQTQEVEAGDNTGAIAYTEKAGYVFAGWYTNKACTKPADFSDVQADMTVYPKYVSAKSVSTKVMPLGKFMNVSVSVPNSDLAQVGVSYTLDGETTNVVCKKSQSLIVGLKKLLGSKATTYTASWSMNGLSNGDTFSVTTYWITADGTMVEIATNDYAYSRNRISVQ